MKKMIKTLPLAFLFLFFTSCNNESEINLNDTISRDIKIELKNNFKNKSEDSKSSSMTGNLKINLINEESDIIEFELSDELIEFIGLPKEEIYSKIYDELNNEGYKTKKYVKYSQKEDSNYTKCINGCNDKYTDENGDKIKGRGWCKAGCFGQAVVDAVVVAIPTVIAIILA